jgi:ABC-type dipeptide/oligopeptide/nickel transport system ATPase subunit
MGDTFQRSAKADYYVTDKLEDVRYPASLAGGNRKRLCCRQAVFIAPTGCT